MSTTPSTPLANKTNTQIQTPTNKQRIQTPKNSRKTVKHTPNHTPVGRKRSSTVNTPSGFYYHSPLRQSSPRCKQPARTKPKHYDRYIPNRSTMDINSSHFHIDKSKQQQQHQQDTSAASGISSESTNFLDSQQLAYQSQVASACGIALQNRILSFKHDPPEPPCHKSIHQRVQQRPNFKHKPATRRTISKIPRKVLDAPGVIDDFYINILDWSVQNQLAIALENTVYIWNANTGSVSEFCSTQNEYDYISSVQFSQDGSYLALGTFSGDAQIWDVMSETKLRSMKGRTSRISVLSWDNHILSSGGKDGAIWNHDVRVQKHNISQYINHTGEVCGLKHRQDGQQLASGGNDNLINIWDVRNGSTSKFSWSEHQGAVKALAWCPWQMGLLASGGGVACRSIRFWNTNLGTPYAFPICPSLAPPTQAATALSSDSNHYSYSNNAASVRSSTLQTSAQLSSLHFSTTHRDLLSTHGHPSSNISLYTFPTSSTPYLHLSFDIPNAHETRIIGSAVGADGCVASVAGDENLKIWEILGGKSSSSTSTSGVKGKSASKGKTDTKDVTEGIRRLVIR